MFDAVNAFKHLVFGYSEKEKKERVENFRKVQQRIEVNKRVGNGNYSYRRSPFIYENKQPELKENNIGIWLFGAIIILLLAR